MHRLLIVGALLASACSGHGLTRDGAMKMIVADKQFNRPFIIPLRQGEFCDIVKGGDFDSFLRSFHPDSFYLRRLGLVRISSQTTLNDLALAGKPNNVCTPFLKQGTVFYYWIQELTAKAVDHNIMGDGDYEFARPDSFRITGITSESDSVSIVEFKWKWARTGLGESLVAPLSTDEYIFGLARFRLYDDGWRVDTINRETAGARP
jgi:hypothetical protein